MDVGRDWLTFARLWRILRLTGTNLILDEIPDRFNNLLKPLCFEKLEMSLFNLSINSEPLILSYIESLGVLEAGSTYQYNVRKLVDLEKEKKQKIILRNNLLREIVTINKKIICIENE